MLLWEKNMYPLVAAVAMLVSLFLMVSVSLPPQKVAAGAEGPTGCNYAQRIEAEVLLACRIDSERQQVGCWRFEEMRC